MSITPKALRKLKSAFLNQDVIVYLKDMNVVTVTPEGQEVMVTAMVQSYVVDIDVDYFYFGLLDGTVLKAISHETSPMIELALTQADAMILMEDYPTSDEDVH